MTIVLGIVDDVLWRLWVGSSSSPVGCLLLWGAVSSWLGLRPVGSGCHCPRAQPSATAELWSIRFFRNSLRVHWALSSGSGGLGLHLGFVRLPALGLPLPRSRGNRTLIRRFPSIRLASWDASPLSSAQFGGHFLLEYLFCYLATGQLVGVEPAGVPSSLRGRGCACSCPSSHWSSYSDRFVVVMRMVSPVRAPLPRLGSEPTWAASKSLDVVSTPQTTYIGVSGCGTHRRYLLKHPVISV